MFLFKANHYIKQRAPKVSYVLSAWCIFTVMLFCVDIRKCRFWHLQLWAVSLFPVFLFAWMQQEPSWLLLRRGDREAAENIVSTIKADKTNNSTPEETTLQELFPPLWT